MPTVTTAKTTVRVRRKQENFKLLNRRVKSNANRAAYNYARAVVADAKRRAPKKTGFLASQIKWERIKPGTFDMFVEGDLNSRTGAFYGVYVEYGTRKMAAQPYFTPALNSQRQIFSAAMKAVFR